jgi:hypothetical protein
MKNEEKESLKRNRGATDAQTQPNREITNFLIVEIFEYSFECFPGYALCKFTDIFGKTHYINEKIPIVSFDNIWHYNKPVTLPQKGYVAGEIINKANDIVTFSTIKPWYIETNENISVFCVYENQIVNGNGCLCSAQYVPD